jgi:hypothetical protein
MMQSERYRKAIRIAPSLPAAVTQLAPLPRPHEPQQDVDQHQFRGHNSGDGIFEDPQGPAAGWCGQ